MNRIILKSGEAPVTLVEHWRLPSVADTTEIIDLTTAAQAGIVHLVRTLLTLRGNDLVLVLAEPYIQQRAGVISALALLPRVSRRQRVQPQQEPEALSWPRFFMRDLWHLLSTFIQAWRLIPAITRQIEKAENQLAVVATPTDIKTVAYLRTDLWFGTKAGGSVGHIAGVANAFVGLGKRLFMLTSDHLELIDPMRIPMQIIRPSGQYNEIIELPTLAYNQEFTAAALNHCRQEHPDVLYQRYSVNNFSGVALSQALHIPLIIEYNGSEVWIAKNWGQPLRYQALSERIELLNMRAATVIVVVSQVMKDELVARGIPAEKILYYPNCIDPERFDPMQLAPAAAKIRKELRIEDKTVIGFISTFSQWHGAVVLASSVKTIVRQSTQKIHFLMIGEGPQLAEVKNIIHRDGMDEHVTFLGLVPQAEAPGYLMACDIFVSPHVPNPDGTKFFGSPTKLFEYMALGKGIVASNLDQIGEVLSDTETAILTTPGDADSFAGGVVRLVNDQALRQCLGQAARSEALRKYTWKNNIEAVLGRFREQSAGPAPTTPQA